MVPTDLWLSQPQRPRRRAARMVPVLEALVAVVNRARAERLLVRWNRYRARYPIVRISDAHMKIWRRANGSSVRPHKAL